jgi:hypothetical protein
VSPNRSLYGLSLAALFVPFTELALLFRFTRLPYSVMSLAGRRLVLPIATDVLLVSAFAATGRLLTGPTLLRTGSVADWLRLAADCFLHGPSLAAVLQSPTSPALVLQLAFVTACIVYVCAVSLPVYYAVVYDALVEVVAASPPQRGRGVWSGLLGSAGSAANPHLGAGTDPARLDVLDLSWRRLVLMPWQQEQQEQQQQQQQARRHTDSGGAAVVSLRSAADDRVWTNDAGWGDGQGRHKRTLFEDYD